MATALAVSHFYFRAVQPDLSCLGLNVLAVCVVLLTLVGKVLFETSADAGVLILFGMIVLGVSSMAAIYLRNLSRAMATIESVKTLGDVLVELHERGLLDDKGLSLIKEYLAKQLPSDGEPWLVKLLMAIGAWGAAICFVICLGIANLLDNHWLTFLAWGSAFVVAATALRRVSNHVFPVQLALAASSVGHGLMIAGAAELFTGHIALGSATMTSIALCLILYRLYPDNLHRFLSCLFSAGMLTTWIFDSEIWPLLHLEIMAKVATIGFVFLYRSDLIILRPLGYAMAISLIASLFLVLRPSDFGNVPWWPANVILAGALIWLFQWIAGGWERLRSEPLMIAVAATICLATITTPGILAALGLMVLGYARNNRSLLALGALFFPVFIVVFYYELQISLFTKSWIMAGSGATLLLARWFLSHRGWAKE